MKAIMAITAALAIVLACGSDDPSGPSAGGDDAAYYPLAVGNSWDYSRAGTMDTSGVQMGTVSGSAQISITGTDTHSGGFNVFVQETHVSDTTFIAGISVVSDSTFTDYVRVTDDGFFGYPRLTDTDSSWMVPFPIQQGHSWNFAEEPPTTGEILSTSVTVVVPAGTFEDCMEMRTIWMDSGLTVTNTADFARNVGQVRNVFNSTMDNMSITVTNSLESYTLY